MQTSVCICVYPWFHCFAAETPRSPARVASMPAKLEPRMHTDTRRCGCDADAGRVVYIRSGATARPSSPVSLRQWAPVFRCRTTWGMIVGTFGGGYLTWVYTS